MKKLFSTGSFVQWYQIKTFGGEDGMKMEGPQGTPATLEHTPFLRLLNQNGRFSTSQELK